jgi:hypothetical protein
MKARQWRPFKSTTSLKPGRVGGAVNDGALAVCTSTSFFGFQTWKAILLS